MWLQAPDNEIRPADSDSDSKKQAETTLLRIFWETPSKTVRNDTKTKYSHRIARVPVDRSVDIAAINARWTKDDEVPKSLHNIDQLKEGL